jgi:hypothetical protein
MLTFDKVIAKRTNTVLSVIYMQKKREFILKIFAGQEIAILTRNFICATVFFGGNMHRMQSLI